MTPALTDHGDNPALTMDDVDAYLTQMVRTFRAHESLLSDCLQCLVAIDPQSMARLRVNAAIALDQVHATRETNPMSDEDEHLFRTRFIMLDTVLARTGSYFKTAEIITLDAARRS